MAAPIVCCAIALFAVSEMVLPFTLNDHDSPATNGLGHVMSTDILAALELGVLTTLVGALSVPFERTRLKLLLVMLDARTKLAASDTVTVV
jgi:hypothetical protein